MFLMTLYRQKKNLLNQCTMLNGLNNLQNYQKFNIFSFSDDTAALFTYAESVNEDNVEYGLQFLSEMFPVGGKDMLDCLETVISDPTIDAIFYSVMVSQMLIN